MIFPGCFALKFLGTTQVVFRKAFSTDRPPVPWRAEPGPLKVVAVDTGTGIVQLNPEDGGVVVAMVRADVVVQENESLHVYQSVKEIRVNGAGFDDRMVVSAVFSLCGFIMLSRT